MNPTATSKSKFKFSSRNLNAVYKAPLRTKPLPDNATGPMQRPTSHMLVLGRAAVAPPAPINTPSRKSEIQVQEVPVSLVPAGSNWAKNAEKCLETEAPEHSPPYAVNGVELKEDEVWTRKSVAKHLRTFAVTSRPKVTIENSGRWGDDAVENDIVEKNLRCQIQKERDFPDLKETLEGTPTCHGHSSASGEMQSMDSLQEPEQRHGRATGRWTHFNKDEMHCSMQETGGTGWSHSQYGQDEDNCWSRGRSRYDGHENRRHEGIRNARSSDPVDFCAHFSRSDVRFDIVASGDGGRALNHSPHRMDQGSALLSRRGASLSSTFANEYSCVHTVQPFRSASPSSAPALGSIAVDLASGRDDHGSDHFRKDRHRTNTEWSTNEESSTLVAKETQSSSEPLSYNSRSPPQQVQLLKRPKMLFDPKTGGILNAEDMMRPDKRQTSGRSGGKDRKVANSGLSRASKRTGCIPEAQAKAPTLKSKRVRAGRKEANLTSGVVGAGPSASQTVVVAVEQEPTDKCTALTIETSSAISLNAAELVPGQGDIKMVSKGSRVNQDRKRVTAEQPLQQEKTSRVKKPPQDACPSKPRTTRRTRQDQKAHHSAVVNVRESSTFSSDKATDRVKRNIPSRYDQRETGGNKLAQHGINVQEGDMQKPKIDLADYETADGCNSGVVMLTDEQQGIEVSLDDDGYETVKSRRVVLVEKKRHRMCTVALAPVLDEKKKHQRALLEEHANVQSKEVQETSGMAAKGSKVATQPAFRPRRKADNSHRNSCEVTKDKGFKRASKQTARSRGRKKVPAKVKIAVGASSTEAPEQVAKRPTEQVPLLKKSVNVTESLVKQRKARQGDEARGISDCNVKDGKPCLNAASVTWKQEQSKRQSARGSRRSGGRSEGVAVTKPQAPGGIAAKARPTQKIRKVYVVKPLAPAPAPVSV